MHFKKRRDVSELMLRLKQINPVSVRSPSNPPCVGFCQISADRHQLECNWEKYSSYRCYHKQCEVKTTVKTHAHTHTHLWMEAAQEEHLNQRQLHKNQLTSFFKSTTCCGLNTKFILKSLVYVNIATAYNDVHHATCRRCLKPAPCWKPLQLTAIVS